MDRDIPKQLAVVTANMKVHSHVINASGGDRYDCTPPHAYCNICLHFHATRWSFAGKGLS